MFVSAAESHPYHTALDSASLMQQHYTQRIMSGDSTFYKNIQHHAKSQSAFVQSQSIAKPHEIEQKTETGDISGHPDYLNARRRQQELEETEAL